MANSSFASNWGSQVGQNHGTIHNNFHFPPETQPQPCTSIPFYRDPDFIHRGDLLDRIDRVRSRPPHRVALVGLGGVGKSQLAIEFAHRLGEVSAPPMRVLWVHAGTRARVEESLRTIADAVKLTGRDQPNIDLAHLLSNWLSNERNGKWVMVLDSADDQDVFFSVAGDVHQQPLATYLPQSPNGCILVTTRDKQLADRLTGNRDNSIEIGPMAEAEALALLEKKLGSASQEERKVMGTLVRALDLIPLAINQAAAYIRTRAPRSSLARYLSEFRKSECTKTRLLEYKVGDLRRDGGASNTVLTTWQISFDHIRSKRPSAADLLALMSFFDRQGIPEWVLKDTRRMTSTLQVRDLKTGTNDREPNNSACTTESESDGERDGVDDRFEDDLSMLRDYCLVTVNEQGNEFEMHGLVQLSMRKWLEASGQQDTFKQQYIQRLATVFPRGDYEDWTTCRSLFAHVQTAVDYQPDLKISVDWARLLFNAGWYALLQGRYEIAERMLRKSGKAYEERLGKEHVLTITNVSRLAEVIRYRGQWNEAETLLIQAIETCKDRLRANHPATLFSMSNLASTYLKQGRWDEAQSLSMQVMETSKTNFGSDHRYSLTNMANVALTFKHQGRLREAEVLELQVMEACKTKLGPDHPDTLITMANLAVTLRDQGRWNEAEALQGHVVEIYKIKLGEDHPDTLTTMANLAVTLRDQGRREEAEALQVHVMEIYKTKLGQDHPDTLLAMSNLAVTICEQGRWHEAEALEVQAMETRNTKLGRDHPETLESMYNVALAWKIQGRHADALALMESCLLARQRVLGPDHPYTLSSMRVLARWNS